MRKRLITEVAGVVGAPVEQVWQALVGSPPGHPMTVEKNGHTVAYQGGWWYRGEWTVLPHPEGSRVEHRVYDVAEWGRWGVALANRLFIGFGRRTREAFAERIAAIGKELGCFARLA
ncbi:hypothetical protein ACFFV7_12375 [Nonomuraea spiralis]|uniref:SRPBCC family protein n=1 Tax=Nonomuraea spiralis TaxID=46182 RepID=A0ABV5IE29_9ACTN|nr:hypothetical protein [Nonomuraea spiralis]GGS79702.1 hypothetical protein GCM10010176_023830 [Nonomuraea spiralis]